jgi:pimeloyl-ACP methyl ester carboxylesterase
MEGASATSSATGANSKWRQLVSAKRPSEKTCAIRTFHVNGVELRTQAFGDPAAPAVLLIMGANASMKRWPESVCRRIADEGRYVIRYDNRDTGRSSAFAPGKPDYDIRDLAKDASAVLDAYRIDRAHMVGFSLGGQIAQHLAIWHGARVLSAFIFASSPDPSAIAAAATGLSRDRKSLSPPAQKVMELIQLLASVNWNNETEAIDAWVREDLMLLGYGDVADEQASRANLTEIVREARNLLSHRLNHPMAVAATPPWRERLSDILAPVLVFHGTDDACFPIDHGRALANEIRNARLVEVEGMGHVLSLSSPFWALFTETLIEHTGDRSRARSDRRVIRPAGQALDPLLASLPSQ